MFRVWGLGLRNCSRGRFSCACWRPTRGRSARISTRRALSRSTKRTSAQPRRSSPGTSRRTDLRSWTPTWTISGPQSQAAGAFCFGSGSRRSTSWPIPSGAELTASLPTCQMAGAPPRCGIGRFWQHTPLHGLNNQLVLVPLKSLNWYIGTLYSRTPDPCRNHSGHFSRGYLNPKTLSPKPSTQSPETSIDPFEVTLIDPY